METERRPRRFLQFREPFRRHRLGVLRQGVPARRPARRAEPWRMAVGEQRWSLQEPGATELHLPRAVLFRQREPGPQAPRRVAGLRLEARRYAVVLGRMVPLEAGRLDRTGQ